MPRVHSTSLFLSCLLLFCSIRPAHADELTTRIAEILDGSDYKQAHWGVLVVDAATGKPLFEQNADRLFAPASVTKLFSCAAALCEFGADYRFETPVYRRGSLDKETLRGDLILVASGDLSMGGRTDKEGRMLFKDHDHTYAHGTSETELTDT